METQARDKESVHPAHTSRQRGTEQSLTLTDCVSSPLVCCAGGVLSGTAPSVPGAGVVGCRSCTVPILPSKQQSLPSAGTWYLFFFPVLPCSSFPCFRLVSSAHRRPQAILGGWAWRRWACAWAFAAPVGLCLLVSLLFYFFPSPWERHACTLDLEMGKNAFKEVRWYFLCMLEFGLCGSRCKS